jgi:hypothetical protein
MSLLITQLDEGVTVYDLLTQNDQQPSLIADPDAFINFLAEHGYALDLTSKEAQKEIAFVQFLTKRYGPENLFCEKYDWSPCQILTQNDKQYIQQQTLKNKSSFKSELSEWTTQTLLDWQPDYDILNDFYNENDIDEEDDFYIDLIEDYVDISYNLKQLLELSGISPRTKKVKSSTQRRLFHSVAKPSRTIRSRRRYH